MDEELELTEEQLAQVQALFDDIQSAVIPLGEKYLESMAELELNFREGTIADEYL
jgi:Spy/CpxP family protein refolding chaperone